MQGSVIQKWHFDGEFPRVPKEFTFLRDGLPGEDVSIIPSAGTSASPLLRLRPAAATAITFRKRGSLSNVYTPYCGGMKGMAGEKRRISKGP